MSHVEQRGNEIQRQEHGEKQSADHADPAVPPKKTGPDHLLYGCHANDQPIQRKKQEILHHFPEKLFAPSESGDILFAHTKPGRHPWHRVR